MQLTRLALWHLTGDLVHHGAMGRRERYRYNRQHGAVQPADRRELEQAGWRTTLEYRENHVRGRDGRLTHVQVVWTAEAEFDHDRPTPMVVSATASTVDKVWSRLRTQVELADVTARRTRDPVCVAAV